VILASVSFSVTRAQSRATAGPSLQDQMIGIWKLDSRSIKKPDGTVTPDPAYGTDPVGYIAYDRTGYMSVQFMRRNRPKGGGIDGYTAYFGRFTVDEQTKKVTHHVEGNVNPDGVGQDNVREVVLEGDKLMLVIRNAASPNVNINAFTRMK
jgi:hypothetical protein